MKCFPVYTPIPYNIGDWTVQDAPSEPFREVQGQVFPAGSPEALRRFGRNDEPCLCLPRA